MIYLIGYAAVCTAIMLMIIGTIARKEYKENEYIQLSRGDALFLLFVTSAAPVVIPIWTLVELEKLFSEGFPPKAQAFLNKPLFRVGKKKEAAE